ncbi:MAG: ATP-binding cassette domain-containing protein [Cytophagales bacterium]|nr:ATP-binding cassette domain-containing protein [Cytophagales bacterium]
MNFEEEPIIRVNDATIYQGMHPILSDLQFDIKKGEFVFLIGRTGSGKTSLLKTLYADLPLKAGEINVAEFDLKTIKNVAIPFLRRKLGIIFQDFQLLMDRNVEENLQFVLRATGWRDKSMMKRKIAEVLIKVGLGLASKKMPHQLSQGEQQRVVIARSLLNNPFILLADEPTGNLDPVVADEILELFREINCGGTAVLMATHNYQFIEKHPQRVFKCEHGRINLYSA